MFCRLFVSVFLLFNAQPAFALQQENPQAGVVYNFTPFSAVGRKKAGLLCAPNGRLLWSDIAPSIPSVINSLMESALREEAEKLWVDSSRRRIVAYISEMDVSACAKHWAFGDGGEYKGRGRIAIEWQIEDISGTQNSFKTTSLFQLEGSASPLEAAFNMAARDLMALWANRRIATTP